MAEIPGATMTFTDYSAPGTPRLLNIPDGHGDVTVQDIWDTLSAESAKLENLMYKKLIDRPKGGGKGILSATKSVGITIVQNNVQLMFPDQTGPAYVIKRVTDGNAVAQDHLEAPMEAIANSDFTNWKNEADVSAALINADLANQIVEGSRTMQGVMRILLAALGGKASGLDTTLAKFFGDDGVKERINATVDEFGNRTSVTLDDSD